MPTRIVATACLLIALAFPLALHAADPVGTTTVFVVRHAEKQSGKDPSLTGPGETRAAELARMLRDVEIAGVYSSQFKRTRETAGPVAAASGQEIVVVPAEGDIAERARALAARILRDHRGKVALVAGHSNTVPLLIEALGVASAPRLTEADYDDLFVVVVAPDDRAELMQLHYGAVTP